MRIVFALLVPLALLAPSFAQAQNKPSRESSREQSKKKNGKDDKKEGKEEPAPAPSPKHVPYEGALGRLSEIMGAMQYLRGLCGTRDETSWRDEMSALIEAESPTAERRARMVASFNQGYRGVSETHRTCTPAARRLIERYVTEGAKLSRDISARYGA